MKYILIFIIVVLFSLIITFILASCKVSSLISYEEDDIKK